MLPLVTNAPIDSAPGATRTPATVPPLSSTVINSADAPNATRTLTEQAVTASPLVRQATGDAPSAKPTLRSITQTGTSQLAAQWIGQMPDLSAEDLTLFAPPPAMGEVPQEAEQGVFYAALKPAAGDAAKMEAPDTKPTTPSEIAAKILATPVAQSLAAESANRLMNRETAPSVLLPTPPVRISTGSKRENVALVRGADAYALTGARSARAESTVSTVL